MGRIVVSGGLNENAEPDIGECEEGQNFELYTQTTQFRPRPPLDLKGTATLGGSISGIMQLVTRDDTETTLIFEDDGATPTIYEWDGSTTFTSKRTNNLAIGSKLRDSYWSLDDYIAITDLSKTTPILKWDGTTCSRHFTGLKEGSTVSVTITSASTTATVTESGHGRSSGDIVHIEGANETEYNGEYEITVTGANTYTYTFAGSATTPATGTITADSGTDLYAKYSIVHDGRIWLFNVKTGSDDNPHMMVASAYETPATFSTTIRAEDNVATASDAFYMLSPDLKPINAAFLFQDQIVISTKGGRLFRLAGVDTTDYRWVDFYLGSAAIGTETAVNIGNDAVYMRKGGNIESLRATEQFGDVSADDLSRWIPDTVKDLTDAITIYDQSNQKVFFFVTNKVLVLFKDFLPSGLSPWSVYVTTLDNDFNAVSAKYMLRPGKTTHSVYWGDASGNIYDMNGTGLSGDGGTNSIVTKRKTKLIDSPIGTLVGNIRYRRQGECELTLNFDWSDEYSITSATIPLSGPPASDSPPAYGGSYYYGGDVYYNAGFEFSNKVSTRGFSPSGIGRSFTLEQYIDTTVSFKIDHIEI